MKAYLLAAGYATRLYPLTRDVPKPLLEIGERPILSQVLDRVLATGPVSEVVVIANHRFAAAFESWARAQSCSVPIHVLDDGTSSDDDKLGAISDLAFAFRERPPGEEDVLVVAGDNWIGFDLGAARADFEERGRRPLLLLRRAPPATGPSAYNEVQIDEAGRVLRFREKPEDPTSPWVAIAVYFYPPRVAALVEAYLASGGNPDAPGFFVEWLVRHAPVQAHCFEGEWMDIGSHETLAAARRLIGATERGP
jgi:glucose-1-phosphate thymidylyltransferase